MDHTYRNIEHLKNTEELTISCAGCAEYFTIRVGELKRRLGKNKKKTIYIYCNPGCKEYNTEYKITYNRTDKRGRPRLVTFLDDDYQNKAYILDDY